MGPALVVSAPASGQGKTTVTAALARYHRKQGRCVRVFKTGPDFLDPMVLERASGAPVYQLDPWMGGEAHCRTLLYEAAAEADLVLIEGVMGLFDGGPSTADLAARFDLPVLAVIDASAMAQSFGAVALGLATYRQDLSVWGVVANRVGGVRHADMLAASVPASVPFLGALSRDESIALPDRHLGLVQAGEIGDLDQRLEQGAQAVERAGLTALPQPVAFQPAREPVGPPLLSGVRIAVARDAAFSFLYTANLDLLQSLGAKLVFFSPLTDACLPPADAVYLPGGYPEL
ncbi:MAG TPA: cobyrinate a,c-diamide synthase, partial [Gammaproteobacteria bacterium]|nr:cobyrinate a,c-diamide synthase [Gammaproteobacteria bacterium]